MTEKILYGFEGGGNLRKENMDIVKRVKFFAYTQGILEEKCNPCIMIEFKKKCLNP